MSARSRYSSFCAGGALLVALLLTGCATTASRIATHQATFDELSPEKREMILKGQVDIGFTADMVFMALGSADRQIRRTSASGESLVWVYLKSRTEFYTIDDTGALRCRRGRSYVGSSTGTRQVPYEAIRILFEKGHVATIDSQVR